MSTLREEHYVEYNTYMEAMINESFFLFCLRYNYGANFHDRFRPEFMREYIYRGSIVRRSPTSGIIRATELFFVIDLDAAPSPIEIPSEIWQLAFEAPAKSGRKFTLRPDTTVKVALVSKEQGHVIIAPISLLLLLAQDQVPIGMMHEQSILSLGGSWEQCFAVLSSCEKVRTGEGGKAPSADISTLDISLFLPLEKIDDLLEVLQREGPHVTKYFVEEVWTLVVSKYNRREGKYAVGNAFQWMHLPFRDGTTEALLAEWADTRRIRRGTHFGDPYYINLYYGPEAGEPKVSWETTPIPLYETRRMSLPPQVTLKENEEFPVPLLSYAPIPTIARYYPSKALQEFAAFYRDEFNRLLIVVEWHGPYLLLRESEIYDHTRETKEGMDEWAQEVATAKAEKRKKLAAKSGQPETGTEGVEEGADETTPPSLVMSISQQEEVRNLLKLIEAIRARIDDIVDVRESYTEKELVTIFEDLVRARAVVDRMAAAGYKMIEIDAAYYPAYDKFERFVSPRRMDAWYFGNIATPDEEGQGEQEEPSFYDVLVKDEGPQFSGLASIASIQSFLLFTTKSGRPTRFFTITPSDTIREDKIPFLQEAVVTWLGGTLKTFEDLMCQCLTLKVTDRLSIGLQWGDIFSNDVVHQVITDPANSKQTIARWFFISTLGFWERLSESELRLYKNLRARELGQTVQRIDPLVELGDWMLLQDKKPELYNKLAQEFAALKADKVEDWAGQQEEQAAAEVTDQKEFERGREGGDPLLKEGYEVVAEDDRYVTYQDASGHEITDLTPEYRDLLEEAHMEGDDLEEDEEEDDDLGEEDEEDKESEEEEREEE